MKAGISIYLGTGLNQNIEILKKAKEADISFGFTSLQIPEEQVGDYEGETRKLLAICREYGIRLIADIGRDTVSRLSCNSIKELRDWGITSIRLDDGYSPEETAALSNVFEIVFNASTVMDEEIRGWENAGADLFRFIACHNYYPKEYTGLSLEKVRWINERLKLKGFQTMAFVPGDRTMRGPLCQGLPTVEAHRFAKEEVALHMLELSADGACDLVLTGDVDLSDEGWRRVGMLNRGRIGLGVSLKPAYAYLAEIIHHDRRDSSEYLFRSVESRALKRTVEPENCVRRKRGSVCISNRQYGRYEGEVEITRQDLPADGRVNVVGQVDQDDLKYLPYLKHGIGVQLNPVLR